MSEQSHLGKFSDAQLQEELARRQRERTAERLAQIRLKQEVVIGPGSGGGGAIW